MKLIVLIIYFTVSYSIFSQNHIDSSTIMTKTKNLILGDSIDREWIFESYDTDMKLVNKCYSGGSFIFISDSLFKIKNCIKSKFVEIEFNWHLKFRKPHHVILVIDNKDEFFINIYKDMESKSVLWMELTSIHPETNRFSDFYTLIYTHK